MAKKPYLTAVEAAGELGVSPATLYAYVSRGLIHSEPGGGKQRARLYQVEDIERLKTRKDQRRDPHKAVQGALRWGEPLLDSAITQISDGKLYYRGLDALALAEEQAFEAVAGLLWTGRLSDETWTKTEGWNPAGWMAVARAQIVERAGWPVQAFQELLARAGAEDPAGFDLRPAAVALCGARILRALAVASGCRFDRKAVPLAEALQEAWAPERAEATPALNAALILCADHELNISSFTARCVASAGSTPYAAAIAGLSALQGFRHGGSLLRVEALFDEIDKPKLAFSRLAARLQRGEGLNGFGHPLYSDGDPRATHLVELAVRAEGDPAELALAQAIFTAVFELTGERPNLDAGLTVLRRSLHLPKNSGLALFALGRCAGWIAHAIEQYAANELIRPRARYVGPPPE